LLLPPHGDPEPFLGVDEVWSAYATNEKAKFVYNVLGVRACRSGLMAILQFAIPPKNDCFAGPPR
jgi:hypothetical protein